MLYMTTWRWRKWLERIPAPCPLCGCRVAGQGLCPACDARLMGAPGAAHCCSICRHPLRGGTCPHCGGNAPIFDRAVAAFDYSGMGQRLIHDFKLRRRLGLSGVLTDLLARSIEQAYADGRARPDWIVPVPARRSSLRQRGFSPPAEIARELSRRLGIPCRMDLLRRTGDGPRQTGLPRAARLLGPAGSFACGRPQAVVGASVAVVDDVMTTGATLNELASILKAAGAARVDAWVLARATLSYDAISDETAASRGAVPWQNTSR